jgi:hypothetical protein
MTPRPASIREAASAERRSGARGEDAASRCADGGAQPEVRMLLEHVRSIAPLPHAVRARAIARARATLATAAPSPDPAIATRATSRRPSWITLLVAVALASAFASAAGALLARRFNASPSPPDSTASVRIAAFETAAQPD